MGDSEPRPDIKPKRKRKRFDELPSYAGVSTIGESANGVSSAKGLSAKTENFAVISSSGTVVGGFSPEVTTSQPAQSKREKLSEDINPFTLKPYSDRFKALLDTRKKLPAWDSKKAFLKLVKKNQVIVLVGETGSGKTTQCPQFLLYAGLNRSKCIACTQPRRVAAMSVAKRVSEEMDVQLGREVGYRVRFEDMSSESTILKYCTDGSLLREAQSNPRLESYSIVILDEAHERTLDTDILFGLLKDVMRARRDLRVIVMSATLDASSFSTYFDNAPTLTIPGRLHPVEIFYTAEPQQDYFNAALKTVLTIHSTEPPGGDILLFLTGEDEIDQMKKAIENAANQPVLDGGVQSNTFAGKYGELMVVPLHGSLPPNLQEKIFESAPGPKYLGGPPGRKVVVATNIAETSITIDGIVYVIDPGLSKQKIFNPRSRVESLLVSPISKASALQRTGRAGRTQPGKCYRLFTETSFLTELNDQTYPEILRSNLNSVVLTLLKLGVKDLVHFDFMEPPAAETLMRALEQLNYLGAISDEGELTPCGETMAEFPLDPTLSTILVQSAKYLCTNDMLTLSSVLSVPNVFLRAKEYSFQADLAKQNFLHQEGDHLTLINVYNQYRIALASGTEKSFCWDNYLHPRSLASAEKIRDQLSKIYSKLGLIMGMGPTGLNGQHVDNVKKGILAGFFMQVAHRSQAGVFTVVKDNQAAVLHPSSVLDPKTSEWIVFNEFVMTSKNFLRICTKIDGAWLLKASPKYYDISSFPDGEGKRKLQSYQRQQHAQT